MCDALCEKEKKFAFIPAPYFPPPVVEAYPCRTVEVDTPIYEPRIKPVIKNIVQETTINIPKIQYKEKIVQVPKVEYRHVPNVKYVETPIYQDRYKYKDVEVPQKQYKIKPVFKVVDVPEVEYVDKFVEKKYKRFKYVPKEVPVPFRPKREIYTEVPVPRYIPQTIDDVIQNNNMGYPGTVPPPHFNELPMYGGYNEGMVGSMDPFATYMVKKEGNKCCLSSLCGKGEKNASMSPVFINSPPPLMSEGNILQHPNMALYPPMYGDGIAYSPPFIIQEEENNFCNCLIETTSNILAASGIAIILAGKLTIDGINFLLKKKEENRNKNRQNNNNDDNTSVKLKNTISNSKSDIKTHIEDKKSNSAKSNQLSVRTDTIDLN